MGRSNPNQNCEGLKKGPKPSHYGETAAPAQADTTATPEAKPLQPRGLSEQKLKANRENAKKSTGPRTTKGKSYSRRNSLKHGLFAMHPSVFDPENREDPMQYQEMLDQLVETYRPVGAAERLEVERIAACWWKLGRTWRYENAEIAVGHAKATVELYERIGSKVPFPEDQARLALLKSAATELETAGRISDELWEKMFAADPAFRKQWEFFEGLAKEKFGEILSAAKVSTSSPGPPLTDSFALTSVTTQLAILVLERKSQMLIDRVWEINSDRVAVPSAEILDRILRAEAATDRSLSRSMDRLERLQRRRKGERVPPSIDVRLS